MSRKSKKSKSKIHFWNGIRFKLITGLLLLVTLSGFLLYFLVMKLMDSNMESQITSDMQSLQTNTEVYVRQLLMLKGENNDEEGFRSCAGDIAEELFNTSQNRLILFTLDGEFLLSHGYTARQDMENLVKDIQVQEAYRSALKGNAAYQILSGPEERYDIYFTMPLTVAKKNIGLVSYYLDYSLNYQQYNQIARTVLNITLLILLLISCVLLIFMTNIIRPIQRLSRISGQVAAEIQNEQATTGNLIGKSLVSRRDELGQLSRDYRLMLRTVEKQFTKIQEDRDNILKLLNSKQEFYNNVTHELKTPLTTIKGYAQLMEDDGLTDEELFHTALDHIQRESTRLHQMVIQLLEMSDKELNTQLSPLDVAAVLNSVAASMTLKARRYQNKILMEGASSLIILGKEDRIRQLFINLIDNAIKYGESGEPIRAGVYPEDGRAVIRITNQGEGISPEAVEHIFEPFYRVDKEHSRELGSAGLGLSICRKIVEEHNGTISVESIPGGLTTFVVQFRLYEEESDHEEDK